MGQKTDLVVWLYTPGGGLVPRRVANAVKHLQMQPPWQPGQALE